MRNAAEADPGKALRLHFMQCFPEMILLRDFIDSPRNFACDAASAYHKQ